MKILHIFNDDKFLDTAFDIFELIPDIVNEYIFYTEIKEYKFKYIKNVSRIRIESNINEYQRIFSDQSIDVIFFHTLDSSKYILLSLIDEKKTVVWSVWGYDIYNEIENAFHIIKLNLFKPLTYSLLFGKKPTFFNQVKKIVKRLLHIKREITEFKRKRYIVKFVKQTIHRVDFCATVLPVEYELLSKLSYFRAKPFYFKYLNKTPEKIISQPISSSLGNNILLGNSADTTNNHLDVLVKLKKLDLCGREILIPMNYGNEYYKNQILEKIKFESNIRVLDTFLPIEEYENIINSCSIAIFGHIRQQALGNIHMCFERGIKVFLYKDSITYKQLKKNGYYVYKIEDLTNNNINIPLSSYEKEHNYKLNLRVASPDIMINKLKESIAELRTIVQ